MGVFDDKRYDQLDWVSQAVQPIETPLAKILESMPEKTLIDYEWFKSGSLDRDEVIEHLIGKVHKERLSYGDKATIVDCFEFQVESPNIVYDMVNQKMHGEIYIVKTKFTLDEDRLKASLGSEGRQYLGQINTHNMDFPRANEMLELLEKSEEGLRSRSGRTKRQVMLTRLEEIFKNNEWNVKNTELANKVSMWIRDYIEKGNLAALSNITRLKVMTYKGGPIYSVEEA